MNTYEHITEFAGLAVTDWQPGAPIENPQNSAFRISVTWKEGEKGVQWTDKFSAFLALPEAREVAGLIVGEWESASTGTTSDRIVEALAAAQAQLPNLKALFLGEITSEESEISWIEQSDVSPILAAFPALEQFYIRGGNSLALSKVSHPNLKTLVIQSGGLDVSVVAALSQIELPQLTHLELWLGVEEYGGTITVADLQPLLSGQLFPQLEYLGLRNSEITDEICKALKTAPILERIKVLDLSLGTLSNKGAEALLTNPALSRLTKLDLHHHYMSQEVANRFQGLGTNVDVSGPEETDDYDGKSYRFVAVSE